MEIDWRALLLTLTDVLSFLVMIVGLVGLLIPIFPGLLVIWGVTLITVLVSGPTAWGWVVLGVITVLTVVGMVVDNLVMGAVVREKGAAWTSIFAALAAGVLGTFIFPPLGGIIAAPLLLFFLEYRRLGDRQQAMNVMRALALGWGWGAAARFAVGFVMVLTWAVWMFAR